jgi:uncharacterized membrane protein YkoI
MEPRPIQQLVHSERGFSMDTTKLRSRRVILPAITALAALVIGGTAWAATATGDHSERDRVGGVATATESSDDDGDDAADAADTSDTSDTDERALTASERTAAEKAALAAVDGGTVREVEAGDEGGTGYEAEVRDAGGTVWEVELDASYRVVSKTVDD